MRAFSDELNHLCLVRECKNLEEEMGIESNLTDRILGELRSNWRLYERGEGFSVWAW